MKFIENGKDFFIKKQREEIETLNDELRKFKDEDIVECEEIVEDDKTIDDDDKTELNDLLHM
jgi:hypothetical protein